IYCLLFLAPVLSFAQTEDRDIDLYLQFNGNYDFTAIGNTLNVLANGNDNGTASCVILDESSANLELDLSTQTIISAQLYWAGSGGGFDVNEDYPADRSVFLNGIPVQSQREFQAQYFSPGENITRKFFSCMADVTGIVTGNGDYTLSGLDLETGEDINLVNNVAPGGPYCNQVNFAGWMIYIIYEDPNLALNQISLFDGLEIVFSGNPAVEILLEGLDVQSDNLAKIGFLAWEGDEGIPVPGSGDTESLTINDQLMFNAQNPDDNQFNSTNSYTGSNELWNMDLDVYGLENIVIPGDVDIQINLGSTRDLVLVNNMITSVNSEQPNASIVFDPVVAICDSGDILIDYTVFNTNSTLELQEDVGIAFYAETTAGTTILLDDTRKTTSILQINESESGSIVLTIPIGDPGFTDVFTLKAVVDFDDSVSETDETNNSFEQEIDLSSVTLELGPNIIIAEGNAICEGLDVTIGIDPDLFDASGYQWYLVNTLPPFDVVEITGATDSFLTITETGRYILEITVPLGTTTECIISDDILVEYIPFSPAVVPDPIVICNDDIPWVDEGVFNLLSRNSQIRGTQSATDTTINYYLDESDAEAGNTNFINPNLYSAFNTESVIIFARLFANVGECFSVVPLELEVRRPIAIETNILPYELCDNDQSGDEFFNLNTWGEDEIINGQTPTNVILKYYENLANAEVPVNEIDTSIPFSSSGQTIWVRAESPDGCTAINSFNLVLGEVPVYTPVPLFQLCDDAVADGFTDFDLDSKNTEIATFGGVFNPDITVTYHLTLPDAEAGTIPSLSSPYTNITNPQPIWVRVV
ncbi:hypothetical protein OAN97_01725, partial [Flavobacteriaceae bacterium]|nr:hypothetical protein [Flavobacteriaceae bacterium]